MNYNFINEEWRDITDYPNYQVSNYGRIKSLPRNSTIKQERILKPNKDKDGYLRVNLYKDGKRKTFGVHRLVATAFIPNPNNLPQINHKDENPLNNCAENLEWCDNKYNINYGGRNEKVAKSLSNQVYQYDKNLNLIQIWQSTQECGRNGFTQQSVASCCKGEKRHKSHKGYIWSYTELKKG